MDELIVRYRRRVVTALTTWPTPRGWASSAAIGTATLGLIGAIGFSTGLYALHPANTAHLAFRLAETFVAPAIGEELVFRGLLVPGRAKSSRFVGALLVSTAVFTLWHVVEAETFLRTAAPMFLRADFLACAATLGVGCAVVRRLTGSLWPAVALHWIMVGVWQTWLGGFTT
jgi:predicted Abi (CAAX) family protease